MIRIFFGISILLCISVINIVVSEKVGKLHPDGFDGQLTERIISSPGEQEIDYWVSNAQNFIKNMVDGDIYNAAKKPKRAKNVIFFLGDGMSLTTVAATRMYMGNENNSLSFEKFPHFGLSKTYCINKQVADSACSATAYLSGVKSTYETIGVTGKVSLNDCKGQNYAETRTVSIGEWAQNKCKATGIVTTTKITDASPSGVYAHIGNRNWENDQEVRKAGCDPNETIDIARQLVYGDVGKNLKIVLAGGRNEFRNATSFDEEGYPGKRSDNRDLIKEWVAERNIQGKAAYVWNKNGLNSIKNDTEYVLGLFSEGHVPYNIDIEQNKLGAQVPTLSEMTVKAIEHLQRSSGHGYFLFVEGGRIDHGHHDNYARIALDETKEFSKTIDLARKMTSMDDTLIIVTADHAHTMTYNGYPTRGSDILGISGMMGSDKLTYLTLSYANGPGYNDTYTVEGGRYDVAKFNLSNPRLRYSATVPLDYETHGGEDVGIYASGPKSHLFVGNYEQSYIPVLLAKAANIGPYESENNDKCSRKTNSSPMLIANASLVFILLSTLLRLLF